MKSAIPMLMLVASTVQASVDLEINVLKCVTNNSDLVEISKISISGREQMIGKVSVSGSSELIRYSLLPEQRDDLGRRVFSDRSLPIRGVDFGYYFVQKTTILGNISVVDGSGSIPLYGVPCKIIN